MSDTYVSNGTPGRVFVQNLIFDNNSITPSNTVGLGDGNIHLTTNTAKVVNINQLNVSHDSGNSAVIMETSVEDEHIIIRSSGNGNIYLGNVNNAVKVTTLSLAGNKIVSDIYDGTVFIDPNGPSGTVNLYNQLYVHGGNVGIGTNTPSDKLHVIGNIKLTGTLLDSNGAPYMSSWIKSGNDVYYSAGNAIVGASSAPSGKFDVVASNNRGLVVTGDAGTSVAQGTFSGSSNTLLLRSGNSNSSNYVLSVEKNDFSNVLRVGNDGLIGVGTVTPSYGLDVAVSARMNHSLVVGGTGLVVSRDQESIALIGASSSYIGLYPDDPAVRKGYFGYDEGVLKFDTESSGRHFTFSGGKVGLKTLTPDYDLTINAGSTDSTSGKGNHHAFGILGSGANEALWMGYDSMVDAGYLNVNGLVPLLLQNLGGSVGIGSTSPLGRLDVRKGTASTSGWEAASFGAETSSNDLLVLGNYNNRAVIAGKNATMDADANLVLAPTGGNVGVGVMNPAFKLDVDGNVNINGRLYHNGYSIGYMNFFENSGNVYLNTGNFGIGTSNPTFALDIAGSINYTGNIYKNGVLVASGGSGLWSVSGSDIYFSGGNVGIGTTTPSETLEVVGTLKTSGKAVTGAVELENNVISSSDKGEVMIGQLLTASGKTGYANADGSSMSVYDYYHASKAMDSYELVPDLTSNTSSGSVVGNGTHGLIAEYYRGYAWNTLMNTVHDTQINYGNNAQFMSKVREYSGSFNRMFSVKWSGNLTLPAGSYDLIIDDAILAPANHTVTDLFESGPYDEVNQPHVDNWYNTSWANASWYALMNGMRLPYLSEILARRELGVDLKAYAAMFDDTSVSDLDAWSLVSNNSQWQYPGKFVSINTGGEGDTTENFGTIGGYDADDDEFLLFMRSDCRMFDTRYIDNDYNQPNMDANTNKGSWASKKRFAEAVGGRLPTIEEVRARKFLMCYGVGRSSSNMWIPCTNSAHSGQSTDPSGDYVQIGAFVQSGYEFGKDLRTPYGWSGAHIDDTFPTYGTYTVVIFDNMDQALSYNGSNITGTNIVTKTVSGPYTKKYSVTIPDNGEYSIEFSKNGQGYRQLLLAPQNGDRKRWLTPLDFSVSHSSVVDRYKAFDGSLVDEFTSLNYIREPIGWIGTSKTVLDSVVLGAKSGSEMFMPRLFDVEGTVDGVHWKRLKTFGAVRSYGQKEFNVGSGLGCIGYRIVVLGTFMSGVDDVVKLSLLQFKTRGYESFSLPSESGKMINLTNTDEDMYITSNSGVVNVADVAFKDNSLFVRKLQSETDIGRLIDWNGTSTIPEGYVIADGTEYVGDDYPEAYKKSLEDIAIISDIVPALKSNTSSSEGSVVTGSETVPNGLIAHCYDTGSNGTSYVYVKSELVDNIDMDDTAFNALFNSSNQDTAIINFEGYLYINSSADYTFYINVDGYGNIMIDDEQLGYHTGTVNTWVDFTTYTGSSSQATKYLSQGYHKIRVIKYEGVGTAGIHIAMATGGTPVSNISDSDIIPSSSFVPYLKEDYYKAFDKKDLLTMSPQLLDTFYVREKIPGMEKNSMAIRSSMVAFYEYIGWYSSEAYMVTYFSIAPYNQQFYYLYAVDFELQGSNDNSNWTTIQSYAGATGSIINYVNPYGNGYRGYRVKVLSNSSNASSSVAQKMIVCNELGFYGVRFEDAHKHLPRNLVPVMTSNTTPRGTAISKTIYDSSSEPWKAFDNDNTSRYHTALFVGAALNEEQYLGWYDPSLTKKKIIHSFSIYARDIRFIDTNPVYFNLQGTLDGFTWYDIETFSRTYMRLDNYVEHFVVSKENYIECYGFRLLLIAPNIGSNNYYFDINFLQVWAFDHGVFNVPNASGKLFKLYEGTSVLKLGKNTDAPYVEYDTTSLGTQKTLSEPVPTGFVSINTGGVGTTVLDVEDYPELIDKHIKVNTEKSLVPTLTSSTSEGVVVSSGIYNGVNYEEWRAFSIPPINLSIPGVYHDSIDGISGSSTIGWYNLALEKKKILRSFVLYGRLNSTHYDKDASPKKFNVQGTNDGVNWTTIETFSDVPRFRFGRRFIVSPSNVSSSNAYLGFRLDILDGFTDSSSVVDSTTDVASPSNIKGTFITYIQFYCIDLETDVLQQPMVFSLVPRHDGVSNPGGTLVNSYPHDNPPQLYGGGNGQEIYQLFSNSLDAWWETNYGDGFNVSPHEPLYIGWYNTSLSSKVILVSVFLHANYPRMTNGASDDYRSSAPVAFDIQGTIDGTNWYFVEHVSIPIVYTSYRYVISNRSTAYKGYRLVLKDHSYANNADDWGTPATGTLLLLGELDLECVNESDLKTLTLANSAGKMLKVSNAVEVGERLNDNLVEVGSLALDTLRGNNELAVGATRKWNGVGYVPRGFAVMRGQRLGTLDYPKVFEALVDLQTPFLINPAMTSDTAPYGVVVYNSVYNSSAGYAAYNAFNRVVFQDNYAYVSPNNPTYPLHLGWYHTEFEKKKVLVEFYVWCRYEVNSDGSTDIINWFMPTVFSVQGTLDGTNWTTIQTYDMSFTVPNGYRKGVFSIDKENRNNAYVGFRLLMFNNNFTNGIRIDIEELSFYAIDEPSKPVVLEPKPLVPNYTDWDNPSGNLVYSTHETIYYPWKVFSNEFSNSSVGWATDSSTVDRTTVSPYVGDYIGWYNTQLLKKKVLIYTRWTLSNDSGTHRYTEQTPRTGFIQGTLDGVNWETIHSFDTTSLYIEYYANNNNRTKAYYGFRLYLLSKQLADNWYVLDNLQFMCVDEDEYFSFELPDSPDTLVNLERVQGIAVEGSIGTNSRGDGLSIKVDNNSETNSALVVSNNIGNEIEEASTTLLNVRNNGGVDIGGYLRIGMSSIDAGQHYQGRFSLFIATTYEDTDPYKYGWWIGGQDHAAIPTDNDLHFNVLRDGVLSHPAMIQDSNSNITMNFTGQHRTFVNDISLSSIDEYTGLIVCASQDAYIKMSGGIAYGQDAITMNESLPVVSLSKTMKDKRCFGVISSMEDPEQRKEANGNFVSLFTKEKGDTRVFINSVGEGAMWVVSGRHGVGGALESGDYITTSNITGYGCLQDDDLLHNYTVAKITMNCNFVPPKVPKMVIKRDDKGENVLDDNGLLQWTQMLNDDGAVVYEDKYLIRYILPDGTVLTEEEYMECIENDADVYIAAFVGCTYHCG